MDTNQTLDGNIGEFTDYGIPYTAQSRYTVKERQDLLALLPKNFVAASILEVGCADGANLRYFCRELGIPETQAVGVDICAPFVDQVSSFRFYHTSAENFLASSDEKFDLVLLSDVLEHIYNPWTLLKTLGKNLSPKSQLLISVPNFQNIRYLIAMSTGDFYYASTGLFDQTHIRFFTRKSITRMLSDLGFSVVSMGYRPDRSLDQMKATVIERLRENPSTNLSIAGLKFTVSQESLDQIFGQQLLVGVERVT